MLAQIVLFDGFDPLDVIAPYEVLHAAGTMTDGAVRAELVSAEGPREVPSGLAPLSLDATARLDPRRADLIVVPGAAGAVSGERAGETSDERAAAAEALEAAGERQPAITELIARALETELPGLAKEAMERPDTLVATVCGGSLLLALAGLTAGRHATTHHLAREALESTGTLRVDARVVDDGDLVTGAGVTSGLDLALYLVEREIGPQIASAVETLFAHERRGTVWSAQGPAPVPNR